MIYYSRVYPDAWKQVDKFRAGRGKGLPFWPEWCFIPLAGIFAIVSTEAEAQGIDVMSEEGMPLINDVGVLGALAAWRVTQGIYRFDPDVYKAVIDTPLTGDLPHDVLFNLPEWCVYIETPGLKFMGKPLTGFFAYLEYDAKDGHKELRLVLDHTTPEDNTPRLISQVIHLGPWPLLESVQKAMHEAAKISKDIFGVDVSLPDEAAEYIQENYAPLVSLLLYICSVNGDITNKSGNQPERPRSKKTKRGPRMFPPNRVTVWDVGVRVGAALRKAQTSQTESGTPKQKRSSPRPHVRRAHWHGYWVGPKDGERKFVLKWLYPILVGVAEDLPVTIRPVD